MDAIATRATCPLIAQGLAPVVCMARTVAINVTAVTVDRVVRSAENALVFLATLVHFAKRVSSFSFVIQVGRVTLVKKDIPLIHFSKL